jgi:hypothetical protein
MLWQRADPEADRTHTVEPLGEIRADDTDESGRKPALRGHDPLRRARERADMPGHAHILGQIEIVEPKGVGRRGDRLVEGERQAGEDSLPPRERRARRCVVTEVDGMKGKRRVSDRPRVEADNVEPRVSQELGGRAPDLAKS